MRVSGLQAVNSAAHAIAVGDGDVFIGGGVESMTRAPYVMAKPDAAFDRGERQLYDTTLGWRFVNPALAAMHYPYSMGETAENVAERWEVGRDLQDAFALASQQKAVAAIDGGRFDSQIVPITIPQRKGDPVVVSRDEHPRADTSAEALAKLRSRRSAKAGTVTAGNSSGINDGASAVLLVEASRARELGLQAAGARRLDGGRRRRSGDHGLRPGARRRARRSTGPASASATSTWSS